MSSRTPSPNRDSVIPGYKGFVPGVKSNNVYAKTSTEASRNVLNKTLDEKIGSNSFINTGKATLSRI